MNCFVCKGWMKEEKTAFMVEIDKQIIIVKNVPSRRCTQCGETTYADDVAHELERIVNELRKSPVEVSIVDYEAKPAA